MPNVLNRRDILKRGLQAGLVAGSGLAGRAVSGRSARPLGHRAGLPVAIQRDLLRTAAAAAGARPRPATVGRHQEAGGREDRDGEDQRHRRPGHAGRSARLPDLPGSIPTCSPHCAARWPTPGPGGSSSSKASTRRRMPEEVLAAGGWDLAAIRSAGRQRVTFEDTRNRGRWTQLLPAQGALGRFRVSRVRRERALREDGRLGFAGQAQGSRLHGGDHDASRTSSALRRLRSTAATSLARIRWATGIPTLHSAKQPVPAGVPAGVGTPVAQTGSSGCRGSWPIWSAPGRSTWP